MDTTADSRLLDVAGLEVFYGDELIGTVFDTEPLSFEHAPTSRLNARRPPCSRCCKPWLATRPVPT